MLIFIVPPRFACCCWAVVVGAVVVPTGLLVAALFELPPHPDAATASRPAPSASAAADLLSMFCISVSFSDFSSST
jgi:hypothetical protein